ncbi:MAG: hypothetical protein SVY53_11095 [Chloroflexota bacterium]|nr:hypothetical protein [Chloroflexota bacterium]
MKHGISALAIGVLTLVVLVVVSGTSCISEQITQNMTEEQMTVSPKQPGIFNVTMQAGWVRWTTDVPSTGRLEYRLDPSDEWILIIDRTTCVVNGSVANFHCSEPGLAHLGCLRIRDLPYGSTVWYRITATDRTTGEVTTYECSETWDIHPKLEQDLLQLALTWQETGHVEKQPSSPNMVVDGNKVQVIIQSDIAQVDATRYAAEALGSTIGSTYDEQVHAWVPVSSLIELAEKGSVNYIRMPYYAVTYS